MTISSVTCAGASRTVLGGEVFREALLKQEYFSILELEIQGIVDTLLKEIENYLTSKTATKNFEQRD